jgi:hypothetical protein
VEAANDTRNQDRHVSSHEDTRAESSVAERTERTDSAIDSAKQS